MSKFTPPIGSSSSCLIHRFKTLLDKTKHEGLSFPNYTKHVFDICQLSKDIYREICSFGEDTQLLAEKPISFEIIPSRKELSLILEIISNELAFLIDLELSSDEIL